MSEIATDQLLSPADRQTEDAESVPTLGARSVRGGAITILAQAVKFVVQTGSTAVLARLLTPSDFGLIAMVATLTGFVGVFKDMGLSTVTIQRSAISQAEISALFWINVLVSAAIAALGIACAPLVGWFYGEPRLVLITGVFSLMFITGGLSAQQYALLVRDMRYGAMAVVQTGSLIFGSVIGIALAAAGASYWALVAVGAGTSLAAAAISWIASGWCPSRPAIPRNMGALLTFGAHVTGANVLSFVVRNLDNLLIGRVCGSGTLGLYTKAYGLVLLPIQQICNPITGVLLPTLSRLQHRPSEYRLHYLAALAFLSFVGMPLIAFAFVEAEILVTVMLGAKWLAAVDLFRLLAPAAFVGTVGTAGEWILLSLGQPRRLFQWSLISGVATIAAFTLGIRWGAPGVALGFSVASCTLIGPMLWWSTKCSPISARDIATTLWRAILASLFAACSLHLLRILIPAHYSAFLTLAMHAVAYAVIYLAIILALPGSPGLFRRAYLLFLGKRDVRDW